MPRLRDLEIRIPDLQHDSPGPELRARHHFLRRRCRQRHPPIARTRAPRTLRARAVDAGAVDAASVFQWAAAAQTELPQVLQCLAGTSGRDDTDRRTWISALRVVRRGRAHA